MNTYIGKYWNGKKWKNFNWWQRLMLKFGIYPKDWKKKEIDNFNGFWMKVDDPMFFNSDGEEKVLGVYETK